MRCCNSHSLTHPFTRVLAAAVLTAGAWSAVQAQMSESAAGALPRADLRPQAVPSLEPNSPASDEAAAQLHKATQACLTQLRSGATANGLSQEDFDHYTRNARLLATTVAAAKGQPEGRESWWDYIAKTVDEQRVEEGRQMLASLQNPLHAISRDYRVDGEPLVAIFGIETNYGTQIGKTDVLNAWLTRACTESNPLWKKNVYASLRLLRDGKVPADAFIGSWSGAFGMTQFIPTSFYELAADGDGDGRIDLYNSLPDALASTANHLRKRRAKWVHDLPAVIEVRVPDEFAERIGADPDTEFVGNADRRSLSGWTQVGVKQADGAALPANDIEQAYLFAPTGRNGPVFLATNNFDAILHYNQSRRYALAVSLLTDRLKGRPPLLTAWPTDDPGLSRAQIKEVQELLLARGHDLGAADGIPGAKTRDAARIEQERLGLPPDGRVGRRILDALKQDQAAVSAANSG